MEKQIMFSFKPSLIDNEECEVVNFELLNPEQLFSDRLSTVEDRIECLDVSIDKYTCDADKFDYIMAVASGVLSGVVDIIFVGKFDLQKGIDWSSEKVNDFVIHVAKITGYKGDDLNGSIAHLEKGYVIPSDNLKNDFAGGLQHHLRDFSHHFSIIGLTFSMLTQFTEYAYGTYPNGSFRAVKVTNKALIGNTIPQKIIFGLVYWVLHIASDMAGTSFNAGAGTGIPGPIISSLKLLSTCPIFQDKDQVNKLSIKISKAFNGTLLADRDLNGKIARGLDGKAQIKRLDFRGELGVLHQLGKQAIPVIINEALVRGFYFINRLVEELKVKKELKTIDWKKAIPVGNRTIERMMTIATGTFSVVDALDAVIEGAIYSKANWVEFARQVAIRINYVGLGRFAVAIGTDVYMGFQRVHLSKERLLLKAETLYHNEAKMYYGETLMWEAGKDASRSMESLMTAIQNSFKKISADVKDVNMSIKSIEKIDELAMEKRNEGLTSELLELLDGKDKQ